jgi:hypothetical protein
MSKNTYSIQWFRISSVRDCKLLFVQAFSLVKLGNTLRQVTREKEETPRWEKMMF